MGKDYAIFESEFGTVYACDSAKTPNTSFCKYPRGTIEGLSDSDFNHSKKISFYTAKALKEQKSNIAQLVNAVFDNPKEITQLGFDQKILVENKDIAATLAWAELIKVQAYGLSVINKAPPGVAGVTGLTVVYFAYPDSEISLQGNNLIVDGQTEVVGKYNLIFGNMSSLGSLSLSRKALGLEIGGFFDTKLITSAQKYIYLEDETAFNRRASDAPQTMHALTRRPRLGSTPRRRRTDEKD